MEENLSVDSNVLYASFMSQTLPNKDIRFVNSIKLEEMLQRYEYAVNRLPPRSCKFLPGRN